MHGQAPLLHKLVQPALLDRLEESLYRLGLPDLLLCLPRILGGREVMVCGSWSVGACWVSVLEVAVGRVFHACETASTAVEGVRVSSVRMTPVP